MSKLTYLLLLLSPLCLTSCGVNDLFEEPKSEENNNVIDYVEWPSDEIQDLVEILTGDSTTILPAFTTATNIEIDDEYIDIDEYFGIYCATDDSNSENVYKTALIDDGWDVSTEKNEGNLYDAFSLNGKVWLNFGYNDSMKELEIFVTYAPILSWPTEIISDYVGKLILNTKTIIPSFIASTYVVNYYESYKVIAINGYGCESSIVEEYKTKVEGLNWNVEDGENSGEYVGISPNKDAKINFYYDNSKTEFNIDVFPYEEPVEGWPLESINNLISKIGATGSVPSYKGGNQTGFSIIDDYFGVGIIVNLKSGIDERTEAQNYIYYLLELGYENAGTDGVDQFYAYPGTTLGITAYYGSEKSFTIALDNTANLEK